MDKFNLFEVIPEEHKRRYYVEGSWVDYDTYLLLTGGNLEGETQLAHIIFSTPYLKTQKWGKWAIFTLSAYKSGDIIIINDFYEIDTTSQDPSIKTIIDLYHANPYLNSLNPDDLYFFSRIINHQHLLRRLINLFEGNEKVRPLSDYNIWI